MMGEKSGLELANNQKVADIIRYTPVCIESGESIQHAAGRMSKQGVSSLLITENEKLVGIITDRDIRKRCVAEGLPFDTPVSHIMTREPYTLGPDNSLTDARDLMAQHHVRHVPVVSSDGTIVGLDASVIAAAGAYPAIGAILPMLTQMMSVGVYDVPKVRSALANPASA